MLGEALPSTAFEGNALLPSFEMVTWLPLIPVNDDGNRMGITTEGIWVVEAGNGLLQLREPESFVSTLPLLEKPRSFISQQIHQILDSETLGSLIEQTFPIVDVIRMGLEMESDYWANLALDWFDELSIIDKQQLVDILKVLSKAKWTSQKTRQKAIRKIGKLDD